jgi:hypothetical protein
MMLIMVVNLAEGVVNVKRRTPFRSEAPSEETDICSTTPNPSFTNPDSKSSGTTAVSIQTRMLQTLWINFIQQLCTEYLIGQTVVERAMSRLSTSMCQTLPLQTLPSQST